MKFSTILITAAAAGSALAAPAPAAAVPTTAAASATSTAKPHYDGTITVVKTVYENHVVWVTRPKSEEPKKYVAPAVTPKATPAATITKPAAAPTKVYVAPAKTTTAAPVVKVVKSDGATYGSWQQLALDLHNEARAAVGAPPMTYRADVAAGACECSVKNANGPGLDHCKYGENLWKSTSKTVSHHDAIRGSMKGWVDNEKSLYPGGFLNADDPNFYKYGHYSQVVWADSTDLGCCIKVGSQGTVATCHYRPYGNVSNQKAY